MFRSLESNIGKEREVLAMENGGNAKVNAIFEARLPNPSLKPSNHADGQTRERYIRDKYERRKYYDPAGFDEYAASAAALPRSSPSSADTGSSSVGPPSDAAKQRLEQRRARINKSVSAVDDSAVSAASAASAPRRKVASSSAIAKAPVSAPPPTMDLLDLMGGFGEETAKESSPAVAKPSASSIDLFDFVVASKPQQQSAAPVEQQPKAAPAALDIMSLYNNVGQHAAAPQFGASGMMQYPPQQMMTANGMGGMPNMMMMPQQQQPPQGMMNPMHQMTHAMQHMNFSPQQQQQQFYQQQQMMMMQQQQQQQMMMMMNNGNNMNNGGFGGPSMGGMPSSNMGSRMPVAATAAPPNKAPEKEDPFAQFGSNVFRPQFSTLINIVPHKLDQQAQLALSHRHVRTVPWRADANDTPRIKA
jgi:Putative GTPase activating protein for Arf